MPISEPDLNRCVHIYTSNSSSTPPHGFISSELHQWAAERYQPTSCRQSADMIMTEAKLPTQPPGKTSGISASAAMPKDLPLWAERNRKIDALRSRSDRQTSGRSKLASLGNTVAVSRLQSFSVSLRKPEDSTIICPTAPQGHNRLRSQSAMQPSSHESES